MVDLKRPSRDELGDVKAPIVYTKNCVAYLLCDDDAHRAAFNSCE